MVQLAGGETPRTLVDLTLRGVKEGSYHVTVRETGDISRGAESTGSVWGGLKVTGRTEDGKPRGYWGKVEVGRDGKGSVFVDREVRVSELIGRGMVVSKESPEAGGRSFSEHDDATVVGVIARSAGMWDNDKTVCSCSGKNVWEERKEQVGKGMM
jgi:copper chaperone for superoxide dismutase